MAITDNKRKQIDWDKVKTTEDVIAILKALNPTVEFYPSSNPQLIKYAKGDK